MDHGLADAISRAATAALEALPAAERGDTYVISFLVRDDKDHPRRPTLTVGTNSEAQVALATRQPDDYVKPNPWWTPDSEDEARWNYAFWLQNELVIFPASEVDARALETWIRSAGLWFDDSVYVDEWDVRGEPITTGFVEACVTAARDLH